MDLYEESEKILCVDGKTNFNPEGFKVLEIERIGRFFNWANSINTGVRECSNENVLYLDCDRILPNDYFKQISEVIKEDVFVFPKSLYFLRHDFSLKELKAIKAAPLDFKEDLIDDHRVTDPLIIRKKNPMSGCVSFTRTTFFEVGGYDHGFEGWGYPDYDFWMCATIFGCEFLPMDCIELHQKHSYGTEFRNVQLMNLWNCVKYHRKWNLTYPNTLYEFAFSLGVPLEDTQTLPLREFLNAHG
jgi:predicted glycosyltransferase involved in capsule biosynthesis